MTDQSPSDAPANGIDLLRTQVERRTRAVPPPRNPRAARPSEEPGPASQPSNLATTPEATRRTSRKPSTPPGESVTAKPASTSAPRAARPRQKPAPEPDRPVTDPDEPLANLAVRVRRSLDARLADLIHAFRQDGVRTSKAELLELLLWELPSEPSVELRQRLADFRQHAPRERPL